MDTLRNTLNHFGKTNTPFLFIIDFEVKNYYVKPLSALERDVLFDLAGFSNCAVTTSLPTDIFTVDIKKNVSFSEYTAAFNRVIEEMREGNTYLLNLTFPTEIQINTDLYELFRFSQAPFKLYFKDKFITFSPERFIKIENNIIKTYPMKGTIDAHITNAQAKILADSKEKAEHTTVVDLLRNDLSIVAKQVRVNRFRYVETIHAGGRLLLQVSSEISGILEGNWANCLGDILLALLPAGSISGAPKRKTMDIIKSIENYPRGFFTGIFGYFDGKNLDSAVMIRFIEKQGDVFIYKSGGGITIDSQVESEYQELLEKIYLPVGRHDGKTTRNDQNC